MGIFYAVFASEVCGKALRTVRERKTRAMEKTKARRDGKAARAERAKKRSALREAKKARRKALCAERRTGLEDLLKKARKRATAHGESEFGKRRFASLFFLPFRIPDRYLPFSSRFLLHEPRLVSDKEKPSFARAAFRRRKRPENACTEENCPGQRRGAERAGQAVYGRIFRHLALSADDNGADERFLQIPLSFSRAPQKKIKRKAGIYTIYFLIFEVPT